MSDKLTIGKIIFSERTVKSQTSYTGNIGTIMAPFTLKDEIANLKLDLEASTQTLGTALKRIRAMKAILRESLNYIEDRDDLNERELPARCVCCTAMSGDREHKEEPHAADCWFLRVERALKDMT